MIPKALFRRLLVAIVVVVGLSACASSTGAGPGGAVIPPEHGDPVVEIVVLAADDLGVIESTVVANGVVARAVEGVRHVPWTREPIDVRISAPGFQPYEHTIDEYPDGGSIEFRLEPVILRGRITTNDGRPLPGALVELGADSDRTDNEGRYALERAVPGMMTISRPAWDTKQQAWDGGVQDLDIAMVQLAIRAMRVSATDVSDSTTWNRILDLADASGINGLVVDLKAEDGTVVYRSGLVEPAAIGAVNSVFELNDVVAAGEDHDLYLIGRIGVFQDNFYAAANPDHAVTTATGELWRAGNGYAWVDPSDPAGYEYSISIAEEACTLGFDEIQFDFVGWPTGRAGAVFDSEDVQEVRVATLTAFLDRAYTVLHPDCAVSVTTLAIVLDSDQDEGVGQLPSALSRSVDVISPTIYTTGYPSGWRDFDDPDDHAVDVVSGAIEGGVKKLDGFAYLRPWLQTWTISESDQRAVQSAVSEKGMGWLLWSNNAGYTRAMLPPR